MSPSKISLSTSFSFEAAHRLVNGYPGQCKNLHGHSFHLTCEIEGHQLNSYGMLRDFADFKVIKKWCQDHWDHATLVANSDLELIDFLKKTHQRYFLFPDNPTSEVIAQFLLQHSEQLGFPLHSVTIHETCTHACTVQR